MSDEAWQFADLEAAYAAGIGAAMHIRADEISNGATVAQMDVRIESTGGGATGERDRIAADFAADRRVVWVVDVAKHPVQNHHPDA